MRAAGEKGGVAGPEGPQASGHGTLGLWASFLDDWATLVLVLSSV